MSEAKVWVEMSQQHVKQHLEDMEDRMEMYNGKPIMLMSTKGYKKTCLKNAIACLDDELYWRVRLLKEKYCE